MLRVGIMKKALPEYSVINDYGGDVVILSFVDGCSTTDIVNKINGTK